MRWPFRRFLHLLYVSGTVESRYTRMALMSHKCLSHALLMPLMHLTYASRMPFTCLSHASHRATGVVACIQGYCRCCVHVIARMTTTTLITRLNKRRCLADKGVQQPGPSFFGRAIPRIRGAGGHSPPAEVVGRGVK